MNKKNIINLLILGILVLAIPLIIGLVRERQNLKSRALVPEVQFGGSSVRTIAGRQVLTLDSSGRAVADLTLTSPFDNQGGPSPTGAASPSPTGTARASASPSPSASATVRPTATPTQAPTAAPGGISYRFAIATDPGLCSTVLNGTGARTGTLDRDPNNNTYTTQFAQGLAVGPNHLCVKFYNSSGGELTDIKTQHVTYNSQVATPSPTAQATTAPGVTPTPTPTPTAAPAITPTPPPTTAVSMGWVKNPAGAWSRVEVGSTLWNVAVSLGWPTDLGENQPTN